MLYGTPNGVGRAHALIAFACAAGVTIPATLATGDPPCEGYWDNTIGQPGMSGGYSAVLALTEYNGDLIAGGSFDTAGGTPAHAVARWDGRSWSPLGAGITDGGSTGWVQALCTYNGDLIAAGFFDQAGGTPVGNIARWDGSAWSSLGDSFIDVGAIRSLHVLDDDLFVGGVFTLKDDPQSTSIARWNGIEWETMGQGVSFQGNPGTVWTMTSYRGELIIGGQFTTADGKQINSIARWDGSTWQPLGSGIDWSGSSSASVFELLVFDDTLIAAGLFDTAGDVEVSGLAQWDGAQWQSFGEGMVGQITSLMIYQGDFHAAGGLMYLNGELINQIARWDGSQWHTLGEGVGPFIAAGESIQSLAIYDDALIAGGLFTVAGGEPTNYITAWYGCGNGSATPGDLNNDGTVDGADLAILLGAWGACADCEPPANCTADLDDSCTVDGADLAILLGNWG